MYPTLRSIYSRHRSGVRTLLLSATALLTSLGRADAQCDPKEYYDQLMSSYHSTIAHNTNGTYSIWGQDTKSSGAANNLVPLVISPGVGTNLYNYSGTILKMSLASTSANFQGFMLTTDSLYTWGSIDAVTGIAAGAFRNIPMPATVNPADVKMMTASRYVLVLLTNSGEVWVRGSDATYSAPLYGTGTATGNNNWNRVTVNTTGTPVLTGITQLAVSGSNGIFAYAAGTNKWYTWGKLVAKGDASSMGLQNRAVEMTAPFSGAPKMIAATGNGTSGLSYFALNATDGKVYVLGDNSSSQLGNNSTSTALSWTNVLDTNGASVLTNVIFISANQHDPQNAAVAAIVSPGNLYVWGRNARGMLGKPTATATLPLPITPNGFSKNVDKCLYVAVGGHTTVYVKDGNKKYCYVGHKVSGSMGDNSNDDNEVNTFDCTTTADARICGATSFDGGDAPDSYEQGLVGFHDIVDNITTLYLGTKPPTFNNNNFKNVAAAADNIAANGDGWEEDAISGAPNYYNTGSFSVTATVKNTTGAAAKLYAWVDWNNNGLFDVAERIMVSVPNGATSAVLSWPTVPTNLQRNIKYYMRLRLTNSTLVNPNDYAVDGELEDFYVKMPYYPPVVANVTTIMSNNNDKTAIPSLVGSEPEGQIATLKITSLPSAAAGTLYLCNPTCNPVAVNQVVNFADRSKLQFDPNDTYTGNATFDYLATDTNGVSSLAAVYMIITTNQPPVANNIASTTIASGVSSSVPSLKGFDADGTIDHYTVTSLPNAATEGKLTYCVTPPAAGCNTDVPAGVSLTPAQVATLSFKPVVGYTGTLNIPYTATDNNNQVSNTAYLSIPVKSTASDDAPPVADNILNPVMSNSNGNTALAPLNGTDMRGYITTYKITSLPSASAGTLSLCDPGCTPVVSGQELTPAQKSKLQFDPLPTYVGTTSFTYVVINDHAVPSSSATATVSIPVGNKAPVAEHLVYNAVGRNAGNTSLHPLSASDPDGTVASYTVATLPAVGQGTLYLCTTPPATGCATVTAGQSLTIAEAAKLTFRPATDYLGTANFTYTATDNNGNVSPVANYNIIVNTDPAAVGNPPVTQNLAATTTSGTPVAVPSLIGSDPDGDLNRYVISAIPPASEGLLELCPGACTAVTAGQNIAIADIANLKFTPAAGFVGMTTISYYAVDNNFNQSNLSDAKIAVTNVPPVAVDITAPKQVNTAGPATLPALSASDVDGTVSNYVITALPGTDEGILRLCTTPPATGCTPVTVGQVLTPAESAKLTFEPLLTFTGYSKFGYTAIDNNGNIGNAAKVTIAAGNAAALPMELLTFNGIAKGCTATLSWTAATSNSMQHFAVQYSADGQQFKTIATLQPAAANAYTYGYTMDTKVDYLFRIACVHVDGQTTYSSVKRLGCTANGQQNIIIAPNPVADVLYLSGLNADATITLIKNDGQVLKTFAAGAAALTIDMKMYSKGVYLLKVTEADGSSTLNKIVKQ